MNGGARITVTLLNILKKRKAGYGLASLRIGGGMGAAVIIKNIRGGSKTGCFGATHCNFSATNLRFAACKIAIFN